MRKVLIIIFVALFVNCVSGQHNEKKFVVLNIFGAKVYNKPTFKSQVISQIPRGKSIIAYEIIKTEDKFYIGTNFELSGSWVKLSNGGFVFSSDLTDKKCIVKRGKRGVEISLLGKLLNKKQQKEFVETKLGKFPKYIECEYYENGSYKQEVFDGCFEHTTTYKGLTLGEVYHTLGIVNYGQVSQESTTVISIPKFKERRKDTFYFEEFDAAQDIKIELKGNGIIVVSSYDCD